MRGAPLSGGFLWVGSVACTACWPKTRLFDIALLLLFAIFLSAANRQGVGAQIDEACGLAAGSLPQLVW